MNKSDTCPKCGVPYTIRKDDHGRYYVCECCDDSRGSRLTLLTVIGFVLVCVMLAAGGFLCVRLAPTPQKHSQIAPDTLSAAIDPWFKIIPVIAQNDSLGLATWRYDPDFNRPILPVKPEKEP